MVGNTLEGREPLVTNWPVPTPILMEDELKVTTVLGPKMSKKTLWKDDNRW